MGEKKSTIGEAASNAANEVLLSKTSSFMKWIKGFITWENLFKLLGALLILFIIWIVFRIIIKAIKKVPSSKLPAQRSAVIVKLIKYLFYVVIVFYILSVFGINLSAIWGAAVISGLAI